MFAVPHRCVCAVLLVAGPLSTIAAAEGSWWDETVWFARDTVVDTGSIIVSPADWTPGQWGVFALGAAAIGTTIGTIDHNTRLDAQSDRTARSDRMAKISNHLGTGASIALIGISAGVGWIADEDSALQCARDGLEASIIASGIISPVLKLAVGRSRPDSDSDGADDFRPFSGNYSFPSGHTTQAFALASVVANTWRNHWWAGGLAYAAASTVGYARINDNQHFLSDVMAGALIGGYVGWMVVDLNRERRLGKNTTARLTADWSTDRKSVGLLLDF